VKLIGLSAPQLERLWRAKTLASPTVLSMIVYSFGWWATGS
jgi:hypothetical protein